MSGRGAALVTGAPRRIGRALALEAAQAGYDVAVHCRSEDEDARSLVAEIESLGRRAAVVVADLAAEDDVRALTKAATQALGPLTLLVNNASTFDHDSVGSLTRASWDRHIEPNLRAPIVLAEAFAAQLPKGREGLIVNVLDQRVWNLEPAFFSYGVSKAALWTATRMLAQALAPHIRVNGIGPGPTLANHSQSAEDFEAEAAATPLARAGAAEDVAHALRYLIDARQVTGQMIAVDAGQHLEWRR